jgi:hypothetical protein
VKIKEFIKVADESMLNVTQRSSFVTGQAVKSIQVLDGEVRQELDLLQKIGAVGEFSPLINAARGQYVDLNDLRTAVIRAMGIIRSRMNSIRNSITIDIFQKCIESLESEQLVPN